MVGLYVCYVVIVVISHWYERKSQQRATRESRSRSHFVPASEPAYPSALESDREISSRSFIDENTSLLSDAEGVSFTRGMPSTRSLSPDQLPNGISNSSSDNLTHHHVLASSELEPPNPIRPSLVGALEFRAISWSLVRSRSQSSVSSSSLRRAQTLTSDQQSGDLECARQTSLGTRKSRSLRTPSISGHDETSLGLHDAAQRKRACSTGIPNTHKKQSKSPGSGGTELLGSPKDYFALSQQANVPSIVLTDLGQERDQLSPVDADNAKDAPRAAFVNPTFPLGNGIERQKNDVEDSLLVPVSMIEGAKQLEPHAGDSYTRNRPAAATAPAANEVSVTGAPCEALEPFSRPWWWPKCIAPSPRIFFLTLLPTLVHWKRKTLIEKALAIFTAPSVFLLTITLPVVDLDNTHEAALQALHEEALAARQFDMHSQRVGSWPCFEPFRDEPAPPDLNTCGTTADTAIMRHPSDRAHASLQGWPTLSLETVPAPSRSTRRGWLLHIQVFTAPWFATLVLWLNLGDTGSLGSLAIWFSCSTIIALLGLIYSFIRTRRRKTSLPRPILCLVGFVVSVVWISTIAGEVVAILKTIGLVFGISDAILGLTIFALGNR